MCVILHKLKENEPFTIKEIKNACKTNPDGFSLAILDTGLYNSEFANIPKIYKTVDVDDFIKTYEKLYSEGTLDVAEYVIHCRIATNGEICKDNCHPFENDNYILWHNGIIGEFSKDKNKVDSKQFLDKYFANGNMKPSSIQKRLDSEPSSKFVLYDKNTHKVYQSSNMKMDKDTGNFRSNEYHLETYIYDWTKYTYGDYNYDDFLPSYDRETYCTAEGDLLKDMTRTELEEYIMVLEDYLYFGDYNKTYNKAL